MTRSMRIKFTEGGPVFDLKGRACDFECTAQRGFVFLATERGSNPIHPDLGTRLPGMPGSVLLARQGELQKALAAAKNDLTQYFLDTRTYHGYEAVTGIHLRPTGGTASQVKIAARFVSPEGYYIGTERNIE